MAECTRRAPEHSDAFRRTVKLYQTASNLYYNSSKNKDDHSPEVNANNMSPHPVSAEQRIIGPIDPKSCEKEHLNIDIVTNASKPKSVFTINEIRKNPFLTKLIVKAAKSYKEKNQPQQTTTDK